MTADSLAQIRLDSYSPNRLKYSYNSATEQIAVFSEVYYNKGWNAYIDGAEVPYFRANYLLRAIPVPAGTHEIEFRFEPASYRIGNTISLISSLILLSLIVLIIYVEIKKDKPVKK